VIKRGFINDSKLGSYFTKEKTMKNSEFLCFKLSRTIKSFPFSLSKTPSEESLQRCKKIFFLSHVDYDVRSLHSKEKIFSFRFHVVKSEERKENY